MLQSRLLNWLLASRILIWMIWLLAFWSKLRGVVAVDYLITHLALWSRVRTDFALVHLLRWSNLVWVLLGCVILFLLASSKFERTSLHWLKLRVIDLNALVVIKWCQRSFPLMLRVKYQKHAVSKNLRRVALFKWPAFLNCINHVLLAITGSLHFLNFLA